MKTPSKLAAFVASEQTGTVLCQFNLHWLKRSYFCQYLWSERILWTPSDETMSSADARKSPIPYILFLKSCFNWFAKLSSNFLFPFSLLLRHSILMNLTLAWWNSLFWVNKAGKLFWPFLSNNKCHSIRRKLYVFFSENMEASGQTKSGKKNWSSRDRIAAEWKPLCYVSITTWMALLSFIHGRSEKILTEHRYLYQFQSGTVEVEFLDRIIFQVFHNTFFKFWVWCNVSYSGTAHE